MSSSGGEQQPKVFFDKKIIKWENNWKYKGSIGILSESLIGWFHRIRLKIHLLLSISFCRILNRSWKPTKPKLIFYLRCKEKSLGCVMNSVLQIAHPQLTQNFFLGRFAIATMDFYNVAMWVTGNSRPHDRVGSISQMLITNTNLLHLKHFSKGMVRLGIVSELRESVDPNPHCTSRD